MIEIAPPSNNYMSFEDALLYCAFCTHNGHRDWRLPTAYEYQFNKKIFNSWYLDRDIFDMLDLWLVTPVRDV